jgi:sulfate adenylyltransferase/3'-phosphoadenosine 5'-phosphosulfate synthase
VVWFTGLSGSGKSTLATLVGAELRARGVHVEVLDGDEVRTHLSKGLGFSREDRDTNVRRIGFVAKLLARAGACAMTAAISPYRDVRDEQRRAIGRFVEVFCRCSVDVLAARDPKGLYEKALAGQIAHFTGVTDPYEEPLSPEVVVDTAVESKEACVARIVGAIELLGYLEPQQVPTTATLRPHGGALFAPEAHAVEAHTAALEVSPEARAWLRLVASGALSPLRGPLGEKDAIRVRKEGRLESGLAWPAPLVLPLPHGARAAEGDVLALGDGLALAVSSAWTEQGGAANVAGTLRASAPVEPDARRIRAHLGSMAPAAGVVIGVPLDADAAERLGGVLSAYDTVMIVVPSGDADVEARASATALVRDGGLEDRSFFVELPALPVVEPARVALLHALVLKNLGASVAVVPAGAASSTFLSGFTRAELEIELRPY